MSKFESLAVTEPEKMDLIVEQELNSLKLMGDKAKVVILEQKRKGNLKARLFNDLSKKLDLIIEEAAEKVELYKADKISANDTVKRIGELKMSLEISGVTDTQIPVSAEAGRVILERMEALLADSDLKDDTKQERKAA